VPSPCSVQDALLWYCDFQAIPRATLLTILQQYTADEVEKAKLHAWTHEQKEEFVKDEKSLLEVLEELPGIDVPSSISSSSARNCNLASTPFLLPRSCSRNKSPSLFRYPHITNKEDVCIMELLLLTCAASSQARIRSACS